MATIELEFVKFDAPVNKAEGKNYKFFPGAFLLANEPQGDYGTNQGSNSGAAMGQVTFTIKGGADVLETILGLAIGNSTKAKTAHYKSFLVHNNKESLRKERKYDELKFVSAAPGMPAGSDGTDGTVYVVCECAKLKRDAMSFNKDGTARPTVKTSIDFTTGEVITS